MIKNRLIVILSGLMLALLPGCASKAPALEPIPPHAIAADAQPVVIDRDGRG
jgi:hypothetical protein